MRLTVCILIAVAFSTCCCSRASGGSPRLDYYRGLSWKQLVHRLLLLDEKAFLVLPVAREETEALELYQAMKEAAAKRETAPEPLILAEAIVSDLYAIKLGSENHRRRVKRMLEDLLRTRRPDRSDPTERMREIALLRFSRYLVAHGDLDLPLRVLRELAENPPTQWELYDRAKWTYCHGMLAFRIAQRTKRPEECLRAVKRTLDLLHHWFPRSEFPKGHPAETRHWLALGWLANDSGDTTQCMASFEKAVEAVDWGVENGVLCEFSLIESVNARGYVQALAIEQRDVGKAIEVGLRMVQLAEQTCCLFHENEKLLCVWIITARETVSTLYQSLRLNDAVQISRQVIAGIRAMGRPLTDRETLLLAMLYADQATLLSAEGAMLEAVASVDASWKLLQDVPDSFEDKQLNLLSVACVRANIHRFLYDYVVAHETLQVAMHYLERHRGQSMRRRQLEMRVLITAAVLAFSECDYEAIIRLMNKIENLFSPEEMTLDILRAFTSLRVRLALARDDVAEARTVLNGFREAIEKGSAGESADLLRREYFGLERMRTEVLFAEAKWRACLQSLDRAAQELSRGVGTLRVKVDPIHCRYSATCLAALGDYDRALEEIDRAEAALAERQKAGYRADYFLSATLPALKAQILMAKGDYRSAAECALEVARREPQVLASMGASRSIHTATRWALQWERGCDLLMSVEQPANLDLNRVYDRILPYRGLLFRMVARDAKLRRANLSDDDRRIYREYREKQMAVARLAFEAELAEGPRKQVLKDAVGEAERRRNELELRLRQRNLSWIDKGDAVPCSGQVLKNQLAEGEVLLDFVEYCHHSWDPERPGVEGHRAEVRYRVYIVAPHTELQSIELGTCAEIDALIDEWRKEVQAGAGVECGWKLSRKLWHPVRSRLPKKTQRLFVAPAGKIALVSWAALPDRRPEVPLLDRFELTYLPYPGYLVEQRPSLEESPNPPHCLAVGNLEYGSGQGMELAEVRRGDFRASLRDIAPLPGTQRELDAIARYWSRGSIEYLSGEQVTVSRLSKSLRRSQFVHIATHGILASDESIRAFRRLRRDHPWERSPFVAGVRNPLSLMALALSNICRTDSIDESVLLAEEVAAMDLSHVRLVVLSACDTGRGPVLRNSGAFSLQQAFLMAGAGSTVSALWEVPDAATAELMEEFYRQLATRDNAAWALRKAQLIVSGRKSHHDGAVGRGPNLARREKIGRSSPYRPPRDWGGFFVGGLGRLK